ncbi:MAG: TIGR04283 family arsenosugar biosynthesis glycosyltransferase [Alcanivorax sp.]|nr:TIGR04283 family arsenosugar biosynthesis glycosyltransferase [Alcanivorax sp.]
MKPVTVSIIVPVLNEGALLEPFLTGLMSMLQDGDELIVVDGGSDDDSAAIAMAVTGRCQYGASGRARQMNLGALQAKGDWLWFVHADSGVGPIHLARLRAVVPACLWGRFDVRLSGQRPLFRLVASMINLRSRLTGIATGDQAIFVRRSCFRELKGYPDQPLMEDVALTARLRRRHRPRCLRPPVVTSSRRWERRGAWRTIWQMWVLRFRYWRGADPARLFHEYYHDR